MIEDNTREQRSKEKRRGVRIKVLST